MSDQIDAEVLVDDRSRRPPTPPSMPWSAGCPSSRVRKNFDAYLDVPWDDHVIDSGRPPVGAARAPTRWDGPSGTGRCPSPSGPASACSASSPR